MPNFLEQLGQGLRISGGVASPGVFRANQNRELQAGRFAGLEDLQAEKLRNARDEALKNRMTTLVTSGAITPEVYQKVAQSKGWEDLPVGPGVQAQKFQAEQLDTQRQQATDNTLREHVAGIYSDPNIPEDEKPLRAAEAYALSGNKDQADAYAKIATARKSKDTKPQFVELNVGVDERSGKPLMQKHWVRGTLPDGQLDLVPQGEPGVKGALTEVNISQNKPIPTKTQETLTQGFQMLKAFDDIESAIDESGIVKGWVSAAQAGLGYNDQAIKFQTARNNLKVLAQAIIVGIPSNFDVETFIATLPDITQAESVNTSRIKYARRQIKALIGDTIAYYKGTRQTIPNVILVRAKELGIDASGIVAWDGQGDPLSRSIIEMNNERVGGPASIGGSERQIPIEVQEIDEELRKIEKELNG